MKVKDDDAIGGQYTEYAIDHDKRGLIYKPLPEDYKKKKIVRI